jgi:hypothetical protein
MPNVIRTLSLPLNRKGELLKFAMDIHTLHINTSGDVAAILIKRVGNTVYSVNSTDVRWMIAFKAAAEYLCAITADATVGK